MAERVKILITGHKGFIGSHLFGELSKHYEVTGYDIGDAFPSGRFDFVIHLAARGLIRKSVEHPYEYFEDDLVLTEKLLEMSRKQDAVFIFPSSGAAAKPTNPYALSKKQSVEWINLYRRLYSIKAFDLTFFNIYGSGSRKGGVYLFSRMALQGGPIVILGDGQDIRDFVYVTDVVKFISSSIRGEFKPGTYEVGTGIGTSIRRLAEMISEEVGGNIEIKLEPDVIETARRLVASSPALQNPIELREGIRRVIEFIKTDRQ
jgi:UDP-glucose 4-epimerase